MHVEHIHVGKTLYIYVEFFFKSRLYGFLPKYEPEHLKHLLAASDTGVPTFVSKAFPKTYQDK